MNKATLHKVEMELVSLLENGELTREHIIDHFTNLMGDLTRNNRMKELENTASSECWEYCYEQGFTDEERKEYDLLVYEEEE